MNRLFALLIAAAPLITACSSKAPPADAGARDFHAPPSAESRRLGHDRLVPVVVAGEPCVAIAVNATSVAWSTVQSQKPYQETLFNVDMAQKDGGAPLQLLGPVSEIGGLVLDEGHIYWTASDAGHVRYTRLAERGWSELAGDRASPTAIAVDDTHVFWIDSGHRESGLLRKHGAVMGLPKRGGAALTIAGDLRNASLLALDEANVYWTDSTTDGADHLSRRIRRAPKGGGGAIALATTTSRLHSLAVDDGHVYWAERSVIRRVPKAGGEPADVYHHGEIHVRSIALDAESVFFSDDHGGVYRVPKNAGRAVFLAAFPTEEGKRPTLAIDAEALWVCSSRGVTRMSAPRDAAHPHEVTIPAMEYTGVVAFSPDGQGILAGATGGVRRFNGASGASEKHLLQALFSSDRSRVLDFSSDRQSVFISLGDGAVERWDLEKEMRVWRVEADGYEPSLSAKAQVAPGQERLLLKYGRSTETKQMLVLLDALSGARVGQVRVEDVGALALLPGGRVALAGSNERGRNGSAPPLRAWDLGKGTLMGRFDGPPERVNSIAVSRDGRRVVTVSAERRLEIWDVERRTVVRQFETPEPMVAIALVGDGERAVMSASRTCLWDLAAGRHMSCASEDGLSAGGPLAVSPSEQEVAWSEGLFLRVWKLDR